MPSKESLSPNNKEPIQELIKARDSYYRYQKEIISAISKNDNKKASSLAIQIACTLADLCDIARAIGDYDLKMRAKECRPSIKVPQGYYPSIIDSPAVIEFLESVDIFLKIKKEESTEREGQVQKKRVYRQLMTSRELHEDLMFSLPEEKRIEFRTFQDRIKELVGKGKIIKESGKYKYRNVDKNRIAHSIARNRKRKITQ